MKKRRWLMALLVCAGLLSVEAQAQADNYKAHENDHAEGVSEEGMTFFLVFKSHFDIGYSALARDVVHEYRTSMIDKAMDVMDRNADKMSGLRFVWTVPGWPLQQMLWEKQTPERRLRIEKAVRSGTLVTHALPYTTHTETLEAEDLVRGLGYASSLARRYGLPLPTDAKMTDVPAHTWVLPTILRHAGVTFFHMGGNPTNRGLKVPTLFWWEGPDGSRVLTMFSEGYGAGIYPPKGWKHKAWLTFVHAGDNAGPPSAEAVGSIVRRIQEKYPKAKIRIGRMSDFAEAILAENPELPVVRGDMSDSWVHGVMSNPQATALARRVRPMLPALETLHTQEKDWGIMPYEIDRELAALYDQSLMYGEHTWGLANQHFVPGLEGKAWHEMYFSGLNPAYARMVESWKEHVGYIERVEDRLRPEWEHELYTLAENVAQEGFRFVVYNPLPWERSGMARFAMPTQGSIRNPCVKEVTTGRVYPLKVYGADSKRLGVFFAEAIPANGYRTYVLTNEPPTVAESSLKGDANGKFIENRWFKVTFDEARGCIRSIWDKTNQRELVDPQAPNAFGAYVYERYDKAQSLRYLKEYMYDAYKGSHYPITGKSRYLTDQTKALHEAERSMEFHVEEQAAFVQGILVPPLSVGEGKHTAGLVVTLYENLPYIDLRLAVTNKPATEAPEAGWWAFPFKTAAPTYRIGRVGSVIDPAKELVKGSQFNYIWSNTGVKIEDGDYSVGVCPLDTPAFLLGELDFMHYAPEYEHPKSHLYLNLFNNRWNTNFTSFWSGNLLSEVRLWVNPKQADNATGLVVPGWEARLPLQVGIATTPAGKLPVCREGLKVSKKGVLVTAYGNNPDGEGTLLRVWENGGTSGTCDISLPTAKDGVAQPVNLRGVPEGAPIPIRKGKFTVTLQKYAPASWLIY